MNLDIDTPPFFKVDTKVALARYYRVEKTLNPWINILYDQRTLLMLSATPRCAGADLKR
jgi:hypothetical protein